MNEYLKEHKIWWPVSPELLASYIDGSHNHDWGDGTCLSWYKNGLFHRDGDKPAIINVDGTLIWYKNGLLHRDGDKPAVIGGDGRLRWYKNGLRQRDGDKPAEIWADGTLVWCKNSIAHRTTGPAVIYPDNEHQYWINDVDITKEVKSWLKTRQYTYPFTPEQQVEFTLTFG